MVRIEPLGTGIILPAIVIGYELATADQYQRVERIECPEWIIAIDHQAGGYCMRYPTLVGAVQRLADNTEQGHDHPEFLVRGFQAMAEDPDLQLLRRQYPVLQQLVYTQGEEYTDSQLRLLESLLERFFHLPRFTGGCEAFLRFEPCDPAEVFREWRVLQAIPTPGLRQDGPNQRSLQIDDHNLQEVMLSASTRFDREKLREVEGLRASLGAGGLGAFFLWENSD
jgi:hypothetical protein